VYSHRTLLVLGTLAIAGSLSCSSTRPGAGRTSFQALAQAYREAHDAKDVDAILSLVEMGDGPIGALNRRESRKALEYNLQWSIKRISRKRLGRKDWERWEHATLKPLGLMEIEWVPENETVRHSASSYCFGRREGVYYIVVPGPGEVEEGLRNLSQGTGWLKESSPEIKQRALIALAKWRNDQIDGEPILFLALLSQPVKSPPVLCLNLFDEGLDVLGFGIEERWHDANGVSQSCFEEYPVFAHRQQSDFIPFHFVPVQIRQSGQRKDAQQWDEYLKGDGLGTGDPLSTEDWRKTLPAAWVSIPEPNGLSSRVYIYDRAGQKSEPVELICRFRPSGPSSGKP